MNSMILHSLFVDNPAIAEEVYRSCLNDPNYCAAEKEYEQAEAQLCAVLGFSRYNSYEERHNTWLAKLCQAYYLFGLGLREEVLRGFEKV